MSTDNPQQYATLLQAQEPVVKKSKTVRNVLIAVAIVVLFIVIYLMTRPEKEYTAATTDGGPSVSLKCPADKKINVLSAKYGSFPGSGILDYVVNSKCTGADVTAKLQDKCNGTANCAVPSPPAVWFEDPCKGIFKNFMAKWTCK